MSKKAEKAVKNFSKGYNCSQAVFSIFTKGSGMDKETALKIACGFGGGVARGGGICGAVTGAVMVLGLKKFSPNADIQQSKAKVYKIANEFLKRFKKRHGSIICKELLGYDISKPLGAKKIAELDLHRQVCAPLVRDAVEIIEKLM